DLGSSGFDRVAPTSKVGVRPLTVVDRVFRLSRQLAVWTEHLHRRLLHSLIHLAPEDLLNRALGSRHAALAHPREGAHLVEPEDFDLGVYLRKLLPDDRGLARGPSVPVDLL